MFISRQLFYIKKKNDKYLNLNIEMRVKFRDTLI